MLRQSWRKGGKTQGRKSRRKACEGALLPSTPRQRVGTERVCPTWCRRLPLLDGPTPARRSEASAEQRLLRDANLWTQVGSVREHIYLAFFAISVSTICFRAKKEESSIGMLPRDNSLLRMYASNRYGRAMLGPRHTQSETCISARNWFIPSFWREIHHPGIPPAHSPEQHQATWHRGPSEEAEACAGARRLGADLGTSRTLRSRSPPAQMTRESRDPHWARSETVIASTPPRCARVAHGLHLAYTRPRCRSLSRHKGPARAGSGANACSGYSVPEEAAYGARGSPSSTEEESASADVSKSSAHDSQTCPRW